MRRAPPLVIAVLPLRSAQGLVALLVSLAFAGLAWRFQPWALPALPLAAVVAWREARVRERRLRWDGERWWLTHGGSDEQAVALRVVLDLDAWLLLRASPAGRRFAVRHHYLPLNRSTQGAIWGALRATLYSARVAP